MARPEVIKLAMNYRSNGLRLTSALRGGQQCCRQNGSNLSPMAHSTPAPTLGVPVYVPVVRGVYRKGVPRVAGWGPVYRDEPGPYEGGQGQYIQGPDYVITEVRSDSRILLLIWSRFRPKVATS